jgi:hypothetical protein
MSRTIPDDYSGGSASEFTALEPIESEDWTELVRDHNRAFGDAIIRLGGKTATAYASPLANTTETSSYEPLEGFCVGTVHRRELNDTNIVQLQIRVYCEDCDILANARNMSDAIVAGASGSQGTEGLLELTMNLTSSDLAGPIWVYIRYRAATTEAKVWQYEVHGELLRSGDQALLPDGS